MTDLIRNALLEGLESTANDKPVMDESIKDCIVELLSEAYVQDVAPKEGSLAAHDKVYHPKGYKEGDSCKFRQRLKSEQEVDELEIANKGAKGGKEDKKGLVGGSLVDRALAAIGAEKEEKRAKINPQPKKSLKKYFDLGRKLRNLGWSIEDAPDDSNDVEAMKEDMEQLRREAKIKDLEAETTSYRTYKQAWEDYGNLKNEAGEKHAQAIDLLEAYDYPRVELLIAELKRYPQMLEEGYGNVEKKYEEVCDELCSIMEHKGRRKGNENQDFTNQEREGIGMLQGEDFKAYQKRQKEIGNAKKIPLTIKKIDEIVAKTEPRWRSVAGISREEFAEVKGNWQKTVANLMARSSLASNMQIGGINGMLEGHLQSQHDLARKGERFDDGNHQRDSIIVGDERMPRYIFTQKCFGTEKGMDESEYEKYGCLHSLNPQEGDNLNGGMYGKNVVRWKPHKTIATMTCTDSLCLASEGLNYVNPCLVTNPSPCCFNPEERTVIDALKKGPLNMGLGALCYRFGAPYIELQLHGRDHYNAEAVDSISFGSENDVKNLSKGALAKILEYGIPCYIGSEPIEIDEDWGVERKAKDEAQSAS